MNANYHKQKYHCQICSRQCQDRDGFNCHLKSKTHEKNMEAIAEHPDLYINTYSQEFEKGYLDIMKRFYDKQWVSANKVYEEYVNDKESIALNMTKWESLNKFIFHLAKANKCKMNPSDKDVYLQYIDKSIINQQHRHHQNKDKGIDDKNGKVVERNEKEIEEILKYKNVDQYKKEYSKVNIEDMKGLEIELNKNNLYLNNKRQRESSLIKDGDTRTEEQDDDNDDDDIWINKGLIVRIEDEELEKGKYFKQKGRIINTNEYLAEVNISEKIINIDQYYLSNIIPSIGSTVYAIKGKHKSQIGKIVNINKAKAIATINLKRHQCTISLSFDQICKYKE